MSTRSTIGVERPDGSVVYVYCHYDGYPSHHVPILVGSYTTAELAEALLAPGDISSLCEAVGEKHPFEDRPDGQCNYYGRDRGETGVDARIASDFAAFNEAANNDYAYVFRAGAWQGRARRGAWMPAMDLLRGEDDES